MCVCVCVCVCGGVGGRSPGLQSWVGRPEGGGKLGEFPDRQEQWPGAEWGCANRLAWDQFPVFHFWVDRLGLAKEKVS
jgi:hypothetical protein